MATSEEKRQEDAWRPARLIPTSGIKGVDEQETRATSALLSVMRAVPEFSKALLKKVGAPAGEVRTYIEVPIKTDLGTTHRPDGAIIVSRGNKSWKAFVEVKTGVRQLEANQIETYLDLAREQGFDALISISNQMTTALDSYPLVIDKRRTKNLSLNHWSWVEILSEAVQQKEFRGIADKDQAWILSELIAYLGHPQSGVMEFQDMGQHWVSVRDGARAGTLRPSDSSIGEVVIRWDQFMQFLCLHLGRDLGLLVKHVLPSNVNAASRKQGLVNQLVDTGRLDGILRVPRASGDIMMTADLRSRTVSVSMDVAAPSDRRSSARVTWLLRQLETAPVATRIEAVVRAGRSRVASLADVREDPRGLLDPDKTKEIRYFSVSLTAPLGMKRDGTRGSFISEATELVLRFYREVVEKVKPWSAAPAKLPSIRETTDASTQPENVVETVFREEAAENQTSNEPMIHPNAS